MRDFFATVRQRHSVRHYRDIVVEEEKIAAILEMACAAPSAGDLQAYHLTVVRSPELRRQLVDDADGQAFLAEAPLCIVFAADPLRAAGRFGERGRDLYAIQDATIAASYAQLAAVAADLASAWVGYFDPQRVASHLGLAPGLLPVAILTFGYAAENPAATPRRPLHEVVSEI
jgi:nitroreductase